MGLAYLCPAQETHLSYIFLTFLRLRIKLIQNIMFVQTLINNENGRMVELVDALDSKSNGSNALRVRVSLRPPKKWNCQK